jgi:hypothetical protein
VDEVERPSGVDFVVLSACNTAAADKPGPRRFLVWRVRSSMLGQNRLSFRIGRLIARRQLSLWDGLFEALKANPHLSHAEALQASMLGMIANSSKPEWVQPRFWAPFIVVGE